LDIKCHGDSLHADLFDYKILFNIILENLIPFTDEIIWEDHRAFRRIACAATDEIFCIRQTM